MESRAIAAGCRLAEATAAWLRRCAEAVARHAEVQGADARVRTPGHRAGWEMIEEERVYFNLDCSAASAGLLVL